MQRQASSQQHAGEQKDVADPVSQDRKRREHDEQQDAQDIDLQQDAHHQIVLPPAMEKQKRNEHDQVWRQAIDEVDLFEDALVEQIQIELQLRQIQRRCEG